MGAPFADETPTARLRAPFVADPPREPMFRCSRLGLPSFVGADDELEVTRNELNESDASSV
jgi:hypothetical protein